MRRRTIRSAPVAPARRSRLAAAAAILPLAVSMIPAGPQPAPRTGTTTTLTTAARRAAQAQEFSVPLGNLRDWAGRVVATLDGVHIDGHSRVHTLDKDCEMHFGAHTPAFRGDPDGLVLEPMNACVEPFPGKPVQNDDDWTRFADQITGTDVIASGVPRIWPEHLTGGGGPSNPNHAVELHPLTSLAADGQTVDFSPDIFAGEFRGGVHEPTALDILRNTSVSVRRNGGSIDISFLFNSTGHIGNFTVLDIIVERTSITEDGAGSFRMNGEVFVDDTTAVPVRLLTVKGSAVNDQVQRIRAGHRSLVTMAQTLVLFSLSPESLAAASDRSHGQPVNVDRPIQLILYGAAESE
jgi:hypothetical protein